MRHLPIAATRDAVDEIEIASPCSVPWDSMQGTDRVRHCGQCRQNVYNIAALTRPEARRLIESKEQRHCVRILRRDDGTVVTADCWTRLRAARRRGILSFIAMLLVVGWSELWAIRFGLTMLAGLRSPRPAPPRVAVMSPPPAELRPPPEPMMGVPPIFEDIARRMPPRLMGKRVPPRTGHLHRASREH